MASTAELILKFTGDSRQLREVISAVRADLTRLGQTQVTTVANASRQAVTETTRSEQRRIAETIKSANQRLREEQRTAREVSRIVAETARQAAAQERIRERAATQLTNVRIREAKRAAKELEASLGQGSGGSSALFGSIATRIPGVGGLASEFASVTTAATAATGAVAGFVVGGGVLVGILAAVGKQVFDLTKQTAEFQGKFFDLSQQVGVVVETLSTLDVIASTTGGNIDTVAASMAIFQKNLEDAHDPTSEEAKLLKQLGVTSLDTETALRQTLKGLFAMGEGARQTDSVLT